MNSTLTRETLEGVLRARRSTSLYNFQQRFAYLAKAVSFRCSTLTIFPVSHLLPLDFPLHLYTLCWAQVGDHRVRGVIVTRMRIR
jgi:hypothetical protein